MANPIQTKARVISMDDRVFDVECGVIQDLNGTKKKFVRKQIWVRIILLRRSLDYIYKEGKKGDSMLNNPAYFSSCTLLLDKQSEKIDIQNNIDIIMVTGIPDPTDQGKTKILLLCRVYMKWYEIPTYSDHQLNCFFDSALATLDKSAYEIRRRGGSGGFHRWRKIIRCNEGHWRCSDIGPAEMVIPPGNSHGKQEN
jgi:hypothetical protein